ncbi:MAG: hypothetical protein LH615_09735 [Ferruginibacter sp.]|nr:hypothetical protein [Ferruginibacter sp.]
MRTIQVNALILSTLFFFNSLCFAQAYKVETLSGSVGGEVLFTESKLSATNKTGRGFTLKGEYVFAGHASATISSGYYFMPGKDVLNIQTVPISAIPAKAGVRYYFGSFYGTGEAGAIFLWGITAGRVFYILLGWGINSNWAEMFLTLACGTRAGQLPIIQGASLAYGLPANLHLT